MELTSFSLHILAMVLMLCDHLWATSLINWQWLNSIGRIAFPIFAFMIVEGYFHTKNLKKYIGRLFLFAVLSEIPFNLMVSGGIFYPFHQNVLWTFLIGILLIHWIEIVKKKHKIVLEIAVAMVSAIGGYLLGYLGMVDYYGEGVLTIFVFYFLKERHVLNLILQIMILYYLNVEMLSGLYFEINLFGIQFHFVQQGLALLALVPIWLYKGKQGYKKRWFQYFCYGFYPLHMLILAIV